MSEPPRSTPDGPSDQRFSPPDRTPLYEAYHSDRYARQRLILQIKKEVGPSLICYVAGERTRIRRDDVLGFAELLCRIEPESDIDLLLHSGGGDIDAADKLITMARDKAKNGALRVIVPHYAKSAATLMALGADTIVMSDSSELGPIDPQVQFPNGQGSLVQYSAFSYVKAYKRFTAELRADPGDPSARLMLANFRPHELVEIERALTGTRHLAERLLHTGMMAGSPVTAPVSKLMDVDAWDTHGQVISAEDAKSIGLTVTRMRSDDPTWMNYWKLYCLQRLAIRDDKKLFESDFVSQSIDGV